MNHSPLRSPSPMARRAFLHQSAFGIGGMALASLLSPCRLGAGSADRWTGVVKTPHTPIRAKRIIFLCMAGGPSHLETFDWKPELKRIDGQAFPQSFTHGQQLAQLQGASLKARGAFCEFQKHGQSGQEISGLFPGLASLADDMAIIRSMRTEQINHDTAHAFMNTGSIIKGRPSLGSWLLYGLGAETRDLPCAFRESNSRAKASRCITSAAPRASRRPCRGRSLSKSSGSTG